jgi:hypothetical protein
MREVLQAPSPAQNRPAQEKQEAAPAPPLASTLAENKKDRLVSVPEEASVAQSSAAPSAPAAVSGGASGLAVSPRNIPEPSQSPESTSQNLASFASAKPDLALGKTAREKAVVMQYGLFNASQTPLAAPTQQQEALTRSAQVRSFLGAPRSGNAQGVLTSFNVEQAGRELRVIDSDGSVYAGPMQPTNTLVRTLNQERRGLDDQAVSKKAVQSPLPAQESEAPLQGSSFQLTGTNRTLNRRVVFEGVLVLTTNQAFLGRSMAQSAREPVGVVNGNQTNGNVQDLHLSGTAVIDGELPFRIEASPVSK